MISGEKIPEGKVDDNQLSPCAPRLLQCALTVEIAQKILRGV